MKIQKPFYPLILTLYPAIHFLSVNPHFINEIQIYYVFVVIIAVVFSLLHLLDIIIKDEDRTSLIVSIIFIYIFSYESIRTTVEYIFTSIQFTEFSLIIAWFLILIPITYALFKISFRFEKLNSFMNLFSLVLFAFAIISAFNSKACLRDHDRNTNIKNIDTGNNILAVDANKVDIYYILFDMHGGAYSLLKYFNYDENKFNASLEAKGFVVAKNSHSNYNNTLQSISSTLNMNYLPLIEGGAGVWNLPDSYDYVYNRVNNKVNIYLHKLNYSFVNLSDWDDLNEIADYKYNYKNENIVLVYLNGLLGTTIFKRFINQGLLDVYLKREDIFRRVKEFRNILSFKSPKYVYLHLYLPHHPIAFTASGEKPEIKNLLMPNKMQYNFVEQIKYSNKLALELVDNIIQYSPNAVIILAGDHGYNRFGQEINEEKLSVLNAIRIPTKSVHNISDSISSVNTFRVVFNIMFNDTFSMLPNKYFILDENKKYFKKVSLN